MARKAEGLADWLFVLAPPPWRCLPCVWSFATSMEARICLGLGHGQAGAGFLGRSRGPPFFGGDHGHADGFLSCLPGCDRIAPAQRAQQFPVGPGAQGGLEFQDLDENEMAALGSFLEAEQPGSSGRGTE